MSQSNNKYKYKNMMLNGVQIQESKQGSTDLNSLDKFLETEKTTNSAEPWSKLDKTDKIKKLLVYAETYKNQKNLDENAFNCLVSYLKDCLDRKKLVRVKDVIYDKETGLIKDIPGLTHTKGNNFTLKVIDKRVSTLKSLAPKKVKTAKNKVDNEDDSSSEAEVEGDTKGEK